jgi:branched-chain amino acid transport system permease protein
MVVVEFAVAGTLMVFLGRIFKLGPKLTALLAVGSSVCGVSAIIATQGAIEADDEDASYAIGAILAIGAIGLVYGLLRSRRGLALAAIRDNEAASGSVGVDAVRMKRLVYVVSAFGAGMTGALIYLSKARISPDAAFSLIDWTAYVIFIVVIGGIGSMEGPIIGVAIFYLLQYYLAALGSWYLMLLGALAIVLMLFAPSGIWGVISHSLDLSLFPVRRKLIAITGSVPDKDGKP